jgi:hypothetical protein
VKIKVEMTLNAETAQRFKETAARLANTGDDGLLASAVLFRIADDYERAAVEASQIITFEKLDSMNDE